MLHCTKDHTEFVTENPSLSALNAPLPPSLLSLPSSHCTSLCLSINADDSPSLLSFPFACFRPFRPLRRILSDSLSPTRVRPLCWFPLHVPTAPISQPLLKLFPSASFLPGDTETKQSPSLFLRSHLPHPICRTTIAPTCTALSTPPSLFGCELQQRPSITLFQPLSN
jgi:hypothetical protein